MPQLRKVMTIILFTDTLPPNNNDERLIKLIYYLSPGPTAVRFPLSSAPERSGELRFYFRAAVVKLRPASRDDRHRSKMRPLEKRTRARRRNVTKFVGG